MEEEDHLSSQPADIISLILKSLIDSEDAFDHIAHNIEDLVIFFLCAKFSIFDNDRC